ncbi:MAG: hypothetical protein LBQ89_01375 [Treponema sp.]|jgi:amino acid transporter|nr:hypothetical protein [Treponema sp.]
MVFFGIVFAAAIMVAMIYTALDKKSNFPTRIASLIALGVMILTIIICLFLVLTDNRVPVDESVLIVGAPVEIRTDRGNNPMVLALLIILLIVLFAFIVIFSFKENRKHTKDLSNNPDGASSKFSP